MDPIFGGGAKGDGQADDTNAINIAINYTLSANDLRCGVNCNSSTTSPALVYFPPGTYKISSPIIMDYYTQLVGDALNPPTIVGTSDFAGIALLDADPYGNGGVNWYINQNNFFRQVRNFVIDVSAVDGGINGAGIHWQVAQATSLQNIHFKMSTNANTQQQGIFMDNGSGGFMGDLTFTGGKYGAFLGNQQFTSRNMTFNGCQTAIFMNWNWGWTLTGITVNGNGSSVGIDMSNSPQNQTVGSIVLADSTFKGVKYGVISAYQTTSNVPATGNTLVLDNVDMSGASTAAVTSADNSKVILAPGKIAHWASGNVYDRTSSNPSKKVNQGPITAPSKASSLLDGSGNIYGRSKPQYETAQATDFYRSIGDAHCVGDGKTDDTKCVQGFLQAAAAAGKIAYFDHAVYLVSDTIVVPDNIRIVGEVWSTIMASGFNDSSNPKPVWQVGSSDGAIGHVEMSDMLFEIKGSNTGAIVIRWNLASNGTASDDTVSGMWDVHVRMGGSFGSDLLFDNCASNPAQTSANTGCDAGFMMFYGSPKSGNLYLENTWFWTADHDMEDPLNRQISVYNGRGVLIRSAGPVWLWGTASEHSILYNYQFENVQALFAGFIQTETPYFQPDPTAPAPYTFSSQYDDPTFTVCTNSSGGAVPCKDAWGLRVYNSNNVLIYSAGFYSFFNNYAQQCVIDENCKFTPTPFYILRTTC